jgi:hypothetical protein
VCLILVAEYFLVHFKNVNVLILAYGQNEVRMLPKAKKNLANEEIFEASYLFFTELTYTPTFFHLTFLVTI